MQRAFSSRIAPWIASGVALAGTGIIAVAPVTPLLPQTQYRSVQLTDAVAHGDTPFPLVDWTQLVENTTANWTGLTEMFNNTTALWSLPEAVYSQGLPKVVDDLSTMMQELAVYNAAVAAQAGEVDPSGVLPPLPNFFADPVLNPVSILTLLLHNALASSFAQNAAQVGWTGVYQNMLPSMHDINTQFTSIFTELGHIFTGGTVSWPAIQADFTDIGTDLTNIWNNLSLAPTTVMNAYLNGYPVVSAATDPIAGTIPSVGDAYTLNAPFTANTNASLTPYFGLLTNPYADVTTNTDGASSFLGTVPLQTGTLASLLQSMQTLSDELLTVTSTVPGSGVSAPVGTGPLTIMGPNTIGFNLDLTNIPVIGTVIDTINNSVIPALNGTLTTVIVGTNTLITTVNNSVISLINDTLTPLSNTLTTVVNPFITAIDDIIGAINAIPGVDIDPIGTVSFTIPSIPNIPTIPLSDIPTIPTIPTDVGDIFNLPGIGGDGVPAYTWDLAQNVMAILGSIGGLAAPVTGTVSSDAIGNFLADNPVMNLGTLFDSLAAGILSGTPLSITSTLPFDWTNLVAETLNTAFTAP